MLYPFQQVSTPYVCINRLRATQSYNADVIKHFFRTIDVMAAYPNTLDVLAANTLINDDQTVSCAPIIAAVVRDLKHYVQLRHEATGQRALPIGYGAATNGARDKVLLEYLSSGAKQARIDFWTASIRRCRQNAKIHQLLTETVHMLLLGRDVEP